MTVYSVDDFNRANNAAIGNSSSGHAWTEQMSVHFSIASNQLSATGTGGTPRGGKHATIDHGAADGVYKVKLASLSNGCYGGIVLRWIDSDNFVRAWVYHQGLSPFQYHLYVDQYVGGVYTVLSGPTVLTFVAGAPLRAELSGSQLLVVYNDTTRVTATLANTTGTKHGVYADSDVSGTSVLDDWEGGPAWTGDQMGVAVLDRFGRANNASALGTAETGQAWSAVSGTWGILGGMAYTSASSSSGTWGGLAVIDAGSAVMTVSAILDSNPASFTDYGITARYVDASNNWVAFLNRDSGGVLAVYAGKAVAGAVTYSIANGIPFATMGPNANLKRYPCSLVLAVDSSNTWRLYVNGYRIGNTPTDSAHSAATKAGLTAYATTANKLDEFMVRTPSGAYVPPQTVSGHHTYPRLVKGLAPDAYWPMDDAAASTLVVDRTAGLADQLVTGTPTLGSADVLPGGRGSSVSGWLNTNTIGHPVTPALAPGTGDFTLMFWGNFDPTKVAAKDWVMIPFSIDTYSFSGSGIQGDGLTVYLAVASTGLGAGIVMRVYLNSGFVDFAGLPAVIDNKTHLVIVERAAGVLSGYIDGTASTSTGALGGPVPSAQDRFFAIGGDPSGNTAGNNYYSQGRQAHTAFWKRALTAAERALLLQGGRELGVSV